MSLITSHGGGGAAAAAERKGRAPKDEGESGPLNMKEGTRVFAKFRDGLERKASVIERKAIKREDGAPSGKFRYYVHWTELNRRMDSWVQGDDVRYDAEGDELAKRERAAATTVAQPAAAAGDSAAPSRGKSAGRAGGKGGGGKSGSGSASAAPVGGGHAHSEGDIVDSDGTVLKTKRKADGEIFIENVEPEHETCGMTDATIREHEEITKVKNVNFIELGRFRMETWYFSPLPKEYWKEDVTETIHFCEFCLKFFIHKSELLGHMRRCTWKSPPGDEIYRGADGVCMWEVDGAKDVEYCQNVSYLAKMFLDHKTLMYSTSLFFFYILTELDEYGYHVVGYFSKEKYSDFGYNLACILALPCHQRKGYGRFLIQFSYELSKKERKVGSPEVPLSDLGLLSYRSYWAWQILGVLRGSLAAADEVSIMQITQATSIKPEQVVSTLQYLGFLRFIDSTYVIVAQPDTVEREYARLNSKPGPVVDASRIHWSPFRDPAVKKDKWTLSAILAGGQQLPY